MRQYVIPNDTLKDGKVYVNHSDMHYLRKVLRLTVGTSFEGIDAQGKSYILTVERDDKETLILDAKQKGLQSSLQQSHKKIVLFQCLPKGKKMDLIVRQATEVGVSKIIPVESQYSISKLSDPESGEKKRDRWQRIVKEAMQQSGSNVMTEIYKPVPFKQIETLFSCTKDTVGLFFHQEPLEKSSLHRYLSNDVSEIALTIGPEGGLSFNETKLLIEWGHHSVHLGANILRTETAAVYTAACVEIIMLEKASWMLKQDPL